MNYYTVLCGLMRTEVEIQFFQVGTPAVHILCKQFGLRKQYNLKPSKL